MNVTIQISDAVYAKLLNGNTCVKGSIRLVNPTEGSFNAYEQKKADKHRTFMKLPHGRVTVSDENVRMRLCIARDETVDAPRAIVGESIDASNFVEIVTEECL